MRQIKFRAWDGEKMLYPYIGEKDGLIFYLYSDNWELVKCRVNEHFETVATSQSKEGILMQFTGLLDKNGKEIHEGDVVKYKLVEGFDAEEDYRESKNVRELISTVVYRNGEFWPREHYNHCDDGFYADRTFDFEIIGNIYENPSLLPMRILK